MSAKFTVGNEDEAKSKVLAKLGDSYLLRLEDLIPVYGMVNYAGRTASWDERARKRLSALALGNIAAFLVATYHQELYVAANYLLK